MKHFTQDRVLGLLVLAFGAWITLYWAPVDSETGLVERLRGRFSIGDALAPTVAGVILMASGAWLALLGGKGEGLRLANLSYLCVLILCLLLSIALMRWAGPALVEAITGAEYRPLRDTVPWKYFGFVMGGTAMILSLIVLVERRLSWSRVLIALGVALFLAAFYDLPFEDLLLPPNGDV